MAIPFPRVVELDKIRFQRTRGQPHSPNRDTRNRLMKTSGSEFKVPISKMAAAVQPSATLAAGAKARQLKAEGVRVYDFSLGEPDFPTPEHICKAAVQAMQKGH